MMTSKTDKNGKIGTKVLLRIQRPPGMLQSAETLSHVPVWRTGMVPFQLPSPRPDGWGGAVVCASPLGTSAWPGMSSAGRKKAAG